MRATCCWPLPAPPSDTDRRARWVWAWALALAVLNAGLGFVAIPHDTIQLLYAALFTVNAAILVWIRDAFRIHGDREVAA